MALAPFDLFAGVVATDSFNLGRFYTLTVHAARRRVFMSSRLLPHSCSQGIVKPLPGAVVSPLPKIMIHALPLWIFARQHPPLDPAHYHIQDRVKHLPHV